MKGQLNIEFVASVLIFGILATYTAFYVYDLLPSFSVQSQTENIKAKAYQISDLLLGDPGLNNDPIPKTNWTRDSVKRVGLSTDNQPYLLNYTKVVELNFTDNQTVKNGFYPEYNLRILIQNASDQNTENYLVKVDNGNATAQAINIIRVAPTIINGNYEMLRIILTIWKV